MQAIRSGATASCTYITASTGNAGGLASNYFAITHPSLPNYLDIFGGSSDHGRLQPLGRLPRQRAESRGQPRRRRPNVEGLLRVDALDTEERQTAEPYGVRATPFVYFDDIRFGRPALCSAFRPRSVQLASDLASNSTTPNFVWITPNVCNDMHDCSVATGNGWLGSNVPPILTSPACTVDRCLVIVTWDEDDGSQSNQVLTIFAGSAAQAGVVSTTRHDHFDVLRTIEQFFGLPTLTANDAAAVPMTELLR